MEEDIENDLQYGDGDDPESGKSAVTVIDIKTYKSVVNMTGEHRLATQFTNKNPGD